MFVFFHELQTLVAMDRRVRNNIRTPITGLAGKKKTLNLPASVSKHFVFLLIPHFYV